jgi:hypothetical protein
MEPPTATLDGIRRGGRGSTGVGSTHGCRWLTAGRTRGTNARASRAERARATRLGQAPPAQNGFCSVAEAIAGSLLCGGGKRSASSVCPRNVGVHLMRRSRARCVMRSMASATRICRHSVWEQVPGLLAGITFAVGMGREPCGSLRASAGAASGVRRDRDCCIGGSGTGF